MVWGIDLVSASASFLNAMLVGRIGMRRMVTRSVAAQIGISGFVLVITTQSLPETVYFVLFVFW